MPKRFPESIKNEAMELFVAGDNTAKEIAEIISKDGAEVKPVTIYAWAKQYSWGEQKDVARSDNQQKIADAGGKSFASLQHEQLERYTELANKAFRESKGLPFEKAFDAVKAVDIAIKGQRDVLSGLINRQFVQDVLGVLVEEISDQDVINRISVKLATLEQNHEGDK
tara:strand:+ start:1052 stop:1555 length:504 start_codon:yes stop_codon:yes gene_type:complete